MTPERLAKRKADGWTLSHWVVTSVFGYLTGTREWSRNPIYKARFLTHQDAQRVLVGDATIRAVFTRTIRVARGHSFSWALARMKEGKRVHRPGDTEAIRIVETSIHLDDGRRVQLCSDDLLATNWELAE